MVSFAARKTLTLMFNEFSCSKYSAPSSEIINLTVGGALLASSDAMDTSAVFEDFQPIDLFNVNIL